VNALVHSARRAAAHVTRLVMIAIGAAHLARWLEQQVGTVSA
jgi:hypothetical protein